jgi:hypothetical protein
MAEKERTDDQKAQDCQKYQKYLASVRLPFEPMIDNIITYVNHSRRKIVDKESKKGQKTGIEVYDGSSMLAKNLLVDGMVGYLCGRNIDWFGYELPGKFNFPRTSGMRHWSGKRMDEMPQVRVFLQDCMDVSYAAFNRSNFYDVIPEFIGDGATCGTANLLAEEEVASGRITFTVPHFRENFIAENQWGRVDTNYRLYKLTLRQLKDKFGMETMKKVDPGFSKAYDDNMHAEKEILHAIYPRSDYDHGKINGKNKPIASMWVYLSPLKLIEETGYNWLPTITWRWRKNNDEWYGRSPAWDAYIDIMLSNQQGRTNLIASHKMAEPPMVAFADMRGNVNVGPRGWTFMDKTTNPNLGEVMPRQLMTIASLPFSVEAQGKTEKIIREHFHVDFFLMLYQAAMNKTELTATQVIEMMGEKAAVLGTRVGMLQSEAFDPIHDRVFEIEMNAGRMPQPPQILMDIGGVIGVQYLGPLAQAQTRLTKSRSIQAGLTLISQVADRKPEALDLIDWDGSIREILDSTGFPAKLIRNDDMVNKIRQMRLQAQEKQRQIENLPKIAKAAAAAGKATQEGSPLAALMGGGTGEEMNA